VAHPSVIGPGWALALLAAYPLVLTLTRRSRLVAVSTLFLYAVGVVTVTVFPIRVRPVAWRGDEQWWSVIEWTPFDVPPTSWVLNVVMFVPLGVLLPLLWPRLNSIRRVAVLGVCASMAIELTQLLLWVTVGSRRTVDVNDLIANTLGALLGLLVLRLVASRPTRPGCSPPASPRSWWWQRAGSSRTPRGWR
jgi:glycopeptide antibiotics resistance protein